MSPSTCNNSLPQTLCTTYQNCQSSAPCAPPAPTGTPLSTATAKRCPCTAPKGWHRPAAQCAWLEGRPLSFAPPPWLPSSYACTCQQPHGRLSLPCWPTAPAGAAPLPGPGAGRGDSAARVCSARHSLACPHSQTRMTALALGRPIPRGGRVGRQRRWLQKAVLKANIRTPDALLHIVTYFHMFNQCASLFAVCGIGASCKRAQHNTWCTTPPTPQNRTLSSVE